MAAWLPIAMAELLDDGARGPESGWGPTGLLIVMAELVWMEDVMLMMETCFTISSSVSTGDETVFA